MQPYIQCPNCRTNHPVAALPPAGTALRCNACGHGFVTGGANPQPSNMQGDYQLQPSPYQQPSAYPQPIVPQPNPYARPLHQRPSTADGIQPWQIGAALGVVAVLVIGVIVVVSIASKSAPTVATNFPINPVAPPPIPEQAIPNPFEAISKGVITSSGLPAGTATPESTGSAYGTRTPLSSDPAGFASSPGTAERIATLKIQESKTPYQYKWNVGEKYRYGFEVKTTGGDLAAPGGKIGLVEYEVDSRLTGLDDDDKEEASGTAFVVHSMGLLATCHHVVAGARSIKVHLGGQVYPAEVVALDQPNDLALLRIAAKNLPALPLADSSRVQLAEDVKAIGFPLSTVLGRNVKITSGTIAGKIDEGKRRLLQVDIAINPGNSGGPLVNMRGEVVGVNSAGLFGSNIQEVSFAVPSDFTQALLSASGIQSDAPVPAGALSGVELAAKVSQSTAFVEVELGSERVAMLAFTGNSRSMGSSTQPAQQVSSRVVSSLSGKIMGIQDDASLGMGLGTFGSMVFERLPDEGETTWEDSEVVPIMLPGGNRLVLSQRMSYSVRSVDDSTLVLTKKVTCRGSGAGVIRVNGQGTWTFDRLAGVPTSLEMEFDSLINLEGQSSSTHSSVRYERLSSSSPSDWQRELEVELAKIVAPTEGEELPKIPPLKALVLEEATDAQVGTMIRGLRGKKRSYREYLPSLEMLARTKPIEKRREEAATALHAMRASLPNSSMVIWIQAVRVWGTEKNVATLLFMIDSPLYSTSLKAISIEAAARLPATQEGAEMMCRLIPDRTLGPLALQALGAMGGAGESPVQELLKSRELDQRLLALMLLSNIGSEGSVAVIETAMKSEADKRLRQVADAAVKNIRYRASQKKDKGQEQGKKK